MTLVPAPPPEWKSDRFRKGVISISAGDVDEGKRRYVVRTEGNLNTEQAIRDVVLRSGAASGGIGRVRVGDVADVQFAFQEPTTRLRFKGQPGLAFNVVREAGANVIAWGAFVSTVINFLILAFVIFMLVRYAKKVQDRMEKEEEAAPEEPAGPTELELLAEIRDALKK